MTDSYDPSITDTFAGAMKTLRRAGVAAIAFLCLLAATVSGIGLHLLDQTDNTVTQHNHELTQTLNVACLLIRSDPDLKRYVPKECPKGPVLPQR